MPRLFRALPLCLVLLTVGADDCPKDTGVDTDEEPGGDTLGSDSLEIKNYNLEHGAEGISVAGELDGEAVEGTFAMFDAGSGTLERFTITGIKTGPSRTSEFRIELACSDEPRSAFDAVLACPDTALDKLDYFLSFEDAEGNSACVRGGDSDGSRFADSCDDVLDPRFG